MPIEFKPAVSKNVNYRAEITTCVLLAIGVVALGLVFSKDSLQTAFKHTIEVIDGCEYLRFASYGHDTITHKGNCKNHEQ